MNHERAEAVNIKATILMLALDKLPPHLHAEVVSEQGSNHDHPFNDAKVSLYAPGQTFYFNVEIKRIHRKESLLPLLDDVQPDNLLICNRLSPFLADFCSEKGLNFIDDAGNARVTIPGFNLWIENKQQVESGSTIHSPRSRPGVGFMKLL